MRKRHLLGAALGPMVLAAGLVAGTGARAAEAEGVILVAAAEVESVVVTAQRDDDYSAERASSATKTDTALRDVPQAITVLTDELIKDQSMHGMAAVVRYVPGVSMGQGEGHRDAPTLRGNASTADFFVDGVRDDVQYYRDLYNAERVEVLKGPNAMIFGRGGGGGVINRVTKKADWKSAREISLEAGSDNHRRVEADFGQGFGEGFAGRIVGLYEDSESFRDFAGIERWGINPSAGWRNERLTAVLSYEHFEDDRTVDRGIPSFAGRPAPADISTFFGDPSLSYATTQVDLVNLALEYKPTDALVIRNRTVFGDYDKFYQNVFPGAAGTPVGGIPTTVSISAYNNGTQRENLFNQTDLVWQSDFGGVAHTVLAGLELGRQDTDNVRLTGYFNGGPATSYTAAFASPTIGGVPIAFAPSASDADNNVVAKVVGIYLQDQIELTDKLQVLAGVRFDSFDLDFFNNRNGQAFGRKDEMVSPRLGLVFRPAPPVSLYASYSVTFLPSSGDQFASLSASTATFEPEEFTNAEVGLKWDVGSNLAVTAALYQLDRENTTAPDPLSPGVIVQTGAQRSRGVELGVSGEVVEGWEVMGGYGWQEAEITSATSAAPAGRRVPLTPEHTFSLWNKVHLSDRFALGVGVIHQSEQFAAIDNAVVLPSFTRADAAVFYRLNEQMRVQVNVENLFDATYFPTSHGNNNILPGAPRTVRVSLRANF